MDGAAGKGKKAPSVIAIGLDLSAIALLSSAVGLYYLTLNPDRVLLFDDSYITLRFAANFFKYGGITYDGSSYFTGATSPLHIACIALLGLFLKLETASLAVGILFFVLSCLMVYLWSLSIYHERQIALLAGLMMSICYWLVMDALNGLETTCFIFFSLLTFYLFSTFASRPYYSIPLFLSVVARPEGWFMAVALFAWQLFRSYTQKDKEILRRLSRALGLFLLLIIPYALLLLFYTGSPLPSTVSAKTLFFAEFQLPVIGKMIFFKRGLLAFYARLLFNGSLFILPLILFARKLISVYYVWLYYFIFYIMYFLLFPGAIGHYWCRYQHIFIPILIMGIAGGVVEAGRLCTRRPLRIGISGLLAAVIFYQQWGALANLTIAYPVAISHARGVIETALWLKEHTPRGSLIAVHDIGAVGYFSERDIIDLVGLVNPEIQRYYWEKKTTMPFPLRQRNITGYLMGKKPDYLVVFPWWDLYFNFAQPENRQYFKHVYSTHHQGYEVFACNWGG